MATPNYTEEEIQFRKRARRRLVGAVVLVAMVVALVPMILPESKPQQDSQSIDIRIPSQDASGYAPKILPAPAAAAAAGQAAPVATIPSLSSAEPTPATNAEKISVAKPDPTPKPAEIKPPPTAPLLKAVPAPAPAQTKTAESTKQTYFVQYGAFSELKNAKQRQSDLKGRGITTFTEVVKTTVGDKVRVRSGPYATREQAEKVREKVKPAESKLVVIGNN